MEMAGRLFVWFMRALGALVLFGFSFLAQTGFDRSASPIGVRLAWLAAWLVILTVVVVVLLVRVRRMDEAQRLVARNRLLVGALSGIVMVIVTHIAASLHILHAQDWPLFCLPAWIIFSLAFDSRRAPMDHEYR